MSEEIEESEEARENLTLWRSVCHTDPQYIETVEYGSRKFSAIDAYYRIQTATALWGPYGQHWKLMNLVWTTHLDAGIVTLDAEFQYPGGAFPISNDHKLEPEHRKKLFTDTLTKALSYLGFCADVFMGALEDDRYVHRKEPERMSPAQAVRHADRNMGQVPPATPPPRAAPRSASPPKPQGRTVNPRQVKMLQAVSFDRAEKLGFDGDMKYRVATSIRRAACELLGYGEVGIQGVLSSGTDAMKAAIERAEVDDQGYAYIPEGQDNSGRGEDVDSVF